MIINLGTNQLDIGGGAKSYSPIPFRDDKAYGIKGQFTISEPNNIFSQVMVKAFITVPGVPSFWSAIAVELDIVPEPFMFFYPFSRLFEGDGQAIFWAERIPKVPGAGEIGTIVTLNLFYDDSVDTESWFK